MNNSAQKFYDIEETDQFLKRQFAKILTGLDTAYKLISIEKLN